MTGIRNHDPVEPDCAPGQSEVLQYRSCLVCNSVRLHYLFSVSGNRVVRCDDCELLLVNPQPGDTDLSRFRQEARPAPGTSPEFADYYTILERYYGPVSGRLFQIGGPPAFRAAAVARGFETMESDDIANLPGEGQYDICLLSNELERARNPRLLLRHAHRLLRPDGAILVVTNVSPSRDKFRADHLFYFPSSALQSLLVDCGFSKIIAGPSKDRKPENAVHLARKQLLRRRKILSVVVPAFNEAQTFPAAFDKLLAKEVEGLDIEIVVVESNSTDGTREAVLKYLDHPRVRVVLEDAPRGKGHAVRTGFGHITGDFVIIQDADLEYDLEDYEALLEPVRQGRAAFVLGARHGGDAWKMRQFNDQPVIAAILNFAHWFFTALINIGFGAHLKDPFTMYKVFRRDCLYGIRFECNRFDFDWEIVINFLRKGYRPLEIPVNYRSRSFAEGKKVSFFRDPLTWFRVFLKLRLSDFDPLKEIERQRREKAWPDSAAPSEAGVTP